jgi:hypothetical protein
MLVFGLIANALVKPLSDRWFMTDEDLAALQARGSRGSDADQSKALGIGAGGLDGRTALAWTAVAVPIAWGVWVTLSQALILFANRI